MSVISGQLCSSCAARVEAISKQTLDDARILINRAWLGDQSKPSDVASTVKKLGYDLFNTSGFRPTFKERLLVMLEQEGIKNTLTFITQLSIAIILIIVGFVFGINSKK